MALANKGARRSPNAPPRLPPGAPPGAPPGRIDAPGSLIISATQLADYARAGQCARCAWVRLHVRPLPYQSFPGIFSSIDRYNKALVEQYFRREGRLPNWLGDLGPVAECVAPPHYSRFNALDPETGATLRGEADAIFRMADGSYAILDYKTSRYTGPQQGMFNNYRAQLNAYAYIAELSGIEGESRPGETRISRLALAYMEPETDDEIVLETPELVYGAGFIMGFRARLVEVELAPDRIIPPLLRRAARMWAETELPPAGQNCRDCTALSGLLTGLGIKN